MNSSKIDPDGQCDRASRQLQKCLFDEGQRLASAGEAEQALQTMYRAYALRPGASPILHAMAPIYQSLDDAASENDCRRGVIPESIEQSLFNARLHKRRIIAARKASRCRHVKTHAPENRTLGTPLSNADPTLRPEFRARKTESRGSFVSILENGAFWFDGYNSVVMDEHGHLLEEHVRGNAHVVAETAGQRPEQRISGTVCLLDARSSSIYYHWMMDVLPKLAVIHQAGLELSDIDWFVCSADSAFQQFTLDHLGIPAEKRLPPWSEGLNRCQRLIAPYLKHDRGDRYYNGLGLGMASWVPTWLRNTFATESGQTGKRIYISRGVSGSRTLLQEEQLVAELQKRQFDIVHLEEMNVVQQARLMQSASVVVAPHGAGLSNIAFCQTGTVIVELFDDYVVPCYWALSELSGLEYHAFLGRDAAPETALAGDKPGRDRASLAERRASAMQLDVQNLLSYLDQQLQAQAMAC